MATPAPPLHTILPEDAHYPALLKTCTAFKTAPTLTAIGNLSLLQSPVIALFCSTQCPDDLVLKTHDLAQSLRDNQTPVISGFHTPIEQDCLKILLQGTQPIIHCPARSLHKLRLTPDQQQAIDGNRLLILSPFSASYPRATATLAEKRNAMIGAIVQTLFIAYAAPDSKTLVFAQSLTTAGKSVMTFEHPGNSARSIPGITVLKIDTQLPTFPQKPN
jgi:predicted Rossmann fold nucleotide-binding protein DprA/Smf involved in DNA uptake